MIKDFFKRNKPIFVVGIITLIVFVVIIFISTKRQTNKPELIKIVEEPKYTVVKENSDEDLQKLEDALREVFEISESEDVTPEKVFDDHMGVLIVEFTDKEGFSPKNTRVLQKQKARWVNKTDHDIVLEQKGNKYEELKNPITIEPGKWFELRLIRDGLFTYEETTSGALGSIIVFEPDFD